MPYFIVGNQKDGRLGPAEAPTTIGTLLELSEPLRLRSIILANTTASPITYIAHLVPPGGTAVDSNQIVPTANVPPNDTLTYDFGTDGIPCTGGGQPPLNDTIQHVASDAGLNVTAVFTRAGR